ncbi:MAG: transporter substrate-binding domain-containing protein [Deltaproteobacteria bacterium]|nr:transporter substrate-binding domain-containing protein [Deltaproteobacteria bacterium]
MPRLPLTPAGGFGPLRPVLTTLLVIPLLTALAPDAGPGARSLVIGTKVSPPFSVKDDAGRWAGASHFLWHQVAQELGLQFEYREADLPGLLAGAKDGTLDAVVATLTVTGEREVFMDFTHPFYTTGLAIAVPVRPGARAQVLRAVFSPDMLGLFAWLGGVLLATGTLMTLLERRRNASQFGGNLAEGIGSGVWWSAVTLTTVGYGDKAPVTAGGRVLAVIWMLTSLVLISSVTATITTALTVGQLEGTIHGPAELAGVRTGTVAASTSESYLRAHQLAGRSFGTPAEGLQALAAGGLDAFVYDAPLLRHLVNRQFGGVLEVLPVTFDRQDYAVGLVSDSPLRERMNRAILRVIATPEWQQELRRALGD